jgi:putative hydrolase of the HAD superfamily
MKLKAIWFDFGGVLSPPIEELFNIYQGKTGVGRAHIEAAMAAIAAPMGVHPLAPIELALLTQHEWGSQMRTQLARLYPALDLSRCQFETHGDQWFADVPRNQHMIDLMLEVKEQGYKVGVLTNNVVEWEGPWRRMLDIDHIVDDIVDSCKVGCRKPEPAIFALAASRLGCRPEECLLIDDLEENCQAARRADWHAIVFRDDAQVTRDLRALTSDTVLV